MKKQNYIQPTMCVVELRQQCQILGASDPVPNLNTNMDEGDDITIDDEGYSGYGR